MAVLYGVTPCDLLVAKKKEGLQPQSVLYRRLGNEMGAIILCHQRYVVFFVGPLLSSLCRQLREVR